jgi:hypothetical protein
MRLPLLTSLLAAASTCFADFYLPESLRTQDNALKALTGFNHNDTQFLQSLGLHFGGWLSFGYNHNFDNPPNHRNGPITFADRTSRVQLNQVNLFLERAVQTEGEDWDLGGRVDFMFGSDTRFTQAVGLEFSDAGKQKWVSAGEQKFNRLALPQAYLQIYAPYGNGITAKLGHFYTLIGHEVVTAPDNFFFTHAYTMQYGEPFTHTGALFSMPLVSNLTLTVGAVAGWDNFTDNLDNAWSFIGGLNWSNGVEGQGALSLALTGIHGQVVEDDRSDRSLYSLVLSYDLTDKLHYTLQHDHGWQTTKGLDQDAHWYGINNYLSYDLSDTLALGARVEWFRDEQGIRVISLGGDGVRPGKSANFYAATLGFNFKPTPWFKIRPEIRYDWSENTKAFDAGKQNDQLLFAVDAVIMLF